MKPLKKIIATLLIALTGIGVANAELKFGIKAGLNVNHMSLSGYTFDNNNRAGWTAGVMTEYQVPLIGLSLDLSVMYARLNTEDNNNNFIQIPLNIKYKFGLPVVGSFLKPYIFTGPSFDFLLKNSLGYKVFQPVWNLGFGLELVKHLQIGASYGFGMNDIIKRQDWDGFMSSKLHNNYWTITAAYLF